MVIRRWCGMTQGGGREARTIGGRGGKGLCGSCVTVVLCYSDRRHDAVSNSNGEGNSCQYI